VGKVFISSKGSNGIDKLKQKGYQGTFSKQEIDNFYKNNEFQQQQAVIPDDTYRKITSPPDCYQIDYMFKERTLRAMNKNINAFFVAINILSRKAYVFPVKSRKTEALIEVFKKFLDKAGHVAGVEGDNEFDNKEFQKFCDSRNINVITNVAEKDHKFGTGDKLGSVA
jgi:CRISPR/Cas system CSM-associated protein Csm2 small subunit